MNTQQPKGSGVQKAEALSAVLLLRIILRHIRLIVVAPLCIAVVFVAAIVLKGRPYVAESIIAPQSSTGPGSRFSGLAAQLGFSGIVGSPGESVEFYATVAKSRELLREVARSVYTVERGWLQKDTVRGNLVELFEISGDTPEQAVFKAVNRLRRSIEVASNIPAGVLRVRTTAEDPRLAEQINRRILTTLNAFNVDTRQTQATQEREFVKERLEVARQELEAAENELANFYRSNRNYASSPHLRFEAARLERRIGTLQEVHRTLAQAYEEARIQVVRNTPVLTIVDPPEGSGQPAYSLKIFGIVVVVVTGCLSVALAFILEYLREEHAKELADFRAEVARTGNPVFGIFVSRAIDRILNQPVERGTAGDNVPDG